MRKNTKMKMIFSALAVLAIAPVAGIAALNASADEATRANYEVVGASIKYKASEQDDQNGIRFAIEWNFKVSTDALKGNVLIFSC